MKEDTPIALGSHLSYPHQKVLCSTLKEILHQDLTSFDAPLLIVIGDVVKEQSLLNNASRLSCFSKQVLFCSVDMTPWPIDDLLLKKGIFTQKRLGLPKNMRFLFSVPAMPSKAFLKLYGKKE